jgi:tRNA dimethylallyltransferase
LAGAKLRIICGPTGAGKSALALELAHIYNAAIVSADSRQIYCGFDIGTAKPTREECESATHYGIDVAEPEERFSAARWVAEADEWVESAGEIDKEPVIVGGTGLYIKALVEPLFPAPELDAARRSELERELESKSISELRQWCKELDPARAHLGRTQLVRAIETAVLSGKRISELHSLHNKRREEAQPATIPAYLVVDPGASLAARIETRVERMLANGWIDEVESLSTKISSDAPAWKASGYSAMRAHIQGNLDLSTAKERVIIETRQYAKRQRTWFRHQLPPAAVTHLNPEDSRSRDVAREWWESAE